jgi:hypothetical protein
VLATGDLHHAKEYPFMDVKMDSFIGNLVSCPGGS